MPGIDETRVKPLGLAILTVSDTRTMETDKSGAVLATLAADAGHTVVAREIVVDDRKQIEERVRHWVAQPEVQVVLSTGGTGITGRDVTPEAFAALYDKEIPGFGELFRFLSFKTLELRPFSPEHRRVSAKASCCFVFPARPARATPGKVSSSNNSISDTAPAILRNCWDASKRPKPRRPTLLSIHRGPEPVR